MITLRTKYLDDMCNSSTEVPLKPSGTRACRIETRPRLTMRDMAGRQDRPNAHNRFVKEVAKMIQETNRSV